MALDQEKEQSGEPLLPTADAGGLSPAGARRRRLAGLGASGVLMTLASQSAMADMVCKSPSAALSGNLASRTPEAVSCLGRSPGFWKNHTSEWVGIATSDRFSKYFYCGGAEGFNQVSCHDILSHQEYDRGNVAMHIMATYLNVTSRRISFLTEESVLSMWREFLTTGAYVPTAGATPWNAADLVMYLSSTQKAGDEAGSTSPATPSTGNNGNSNGNGNGNNGNGNNGNGNNGNGNGNNGNGNGNNGNGNGNNGNGNGNNGNGNGNGKDKSKNG